MPSGAKPGERRGGRQKGTPNKFPAEVQAAIAATGETPRDYMLRVMRDPQVEYARRDEMAKAVAPYVHPKLASVEHGSDDKKPVQVRMTIQFVRAKDGRPA
jgi:hypothetical protein